MKKLLVLFAGLALGAQAHVGSPDIYLDGRAGPYELFITVRTPTVIPGVAELEVRSQSPGVTTMRAVPLPMTGAGAKFAPVPDVLQVSPQDGQLFKGSLWMMQPGSWQVRVTVEGKQGRGTLSVPVPAAAAEIKRMQFGLGALLVLLGSFLVGGVVAMAGASVREARLEPGVLPSASRVRAGRIAMAVAIVIVVAVLWGGNEWWKSEAYSYGRQVYKPMRMRTTLSDGGLLTLRLTDPGWLDGPGWRPIFSRSVDDLVADHNHLMHLYAIRQPGLDVVYHLHPELKGSGVFTLALPKMAAGDYRLYADVVHANGFPETLVGELAAASWTGRPLAGDDASGAGVAVSAASTDARVFALPDGYRMEWLRPAELKAKQPVLFRFRLTQADGSAPRDMAFYMGMLGHAAFVKTDGSVFAHVHPSGSVSMAALMLAQGETPAMTPSPRAAGSMGMDMPGMRMSETEGLPNEVSFPYGFPSAGRYRMFIQMKHGETVETGIFDAAVM